MYRVTDMRSGIYAAEFTDLRTERDSIEGLLEAGDHVLLVNSLEEAAEVNEIIVVEPE